MDGAPGPHGHGSLTAGPIPWQRVRDSALPGNRGSGREVPPESSEHGRECGGRREPAQKTGREQVRQQDQGSAEAEEAQPVSVGRCWVCRDSVGLVPWDLAPAVPGDGSRQAQLALPVCSVPSSPVHREGKLRDCCDVKGHYRPSPPQFWFSWWRLRSEADD